MAEPQPVLVVNPLDVQDGDDVVVRGKACRHAANRVGIVSGGVEIGFYFRACGSGVTVTRPALRLPDEFGAVIRCRIVGKPGHYIAERYGEDGWLVAGLESPRGSGDIEAVIDVLWPGPRKEAGHA